MEDINFFIHRRIQELREKKGVSAREMSLALGQNHSYINKVENGISLPSFEVLSYICEYLNISESAFFNMANQHPAEINTLVTEAQKLNRESLKLLIEIAKQLNEKKPH